MVVATVAALLLAGSNICYLRKHRAAPAESQLFQWRRQAPGRALRAGQRVAERRRRGGGTPSGING